MTAPPYIAKARRRRRNRVATWVFVFVAPWLFAAAMIALGEALQAGLR